MFCIFPLSISRKTAEKVDELRTHLKIFDLLRIKMSDDSGGDDIAAAQVLQKALLQRVPLQKCNIKSLLKLTSVEIKFRRLLSIEEKNTRKHEIFYQ